jgi:hypothetical protein
VWSWRWIQDEGPRRRIGLTKGRWIERGREKVESGDEGRSVGGCVKAKVQFFSR